jgi:alkylation response protein AidB-like acyl-CoA dehydrogenase
MEATGPSVGSVSSRARRGWVAGHGGYGYAIEYPISRVLCDARILSIFEGAAEIQAQVIARGLLGRVN